MTFAVVPATRRQREMRPPTQLGDIPQRVHQRAFQFAVGRRPQFRDHAIPGRRRCRPPALRVPLRVTPQYVGDLRRMDEHTP